MKKLSILFFSLLICISASAQTAYDALMLSINDYEGTARTMALGNAVTALGGDLGSVTINPAGSAVANYSQVTITPGLTFATSTTQGVPLSDGSLPYFERQMKNSSVQFNMPNIGFTFNWDTPWTSGLKNLTVGFVLNKTNSYYSNSYASGSNIDSSFMGEIASSASWDGIPSSDFDEVNAFDFLDWKTVLAYDTGMISNYEGFTDAYIGANEGYNINSSTGEITYFQLGSLEQSMGRKVMLDKYDYVVNVAANISDFVYIGANLGFTSITSSTDYYFREAAENIADFKHSDELYFNKMKYNYSYNGNGFGIYGKLGVIITPGAGFRIGAAVQTPTYTMMNEKWEESAETNFSGKNGGEWSSVSPEGRSKYSFTSPLIANFGLAYTIGKYGVISADYEITDYSSIKYDQHNAYENTDYFIEQNNIISNRYAVSHSFRAGVEFKPIEMFSIRAGYSFRTSPIKNKIQEDYNYSYIYDKGYYLYEDDSMTHQISFGIGFNSKGSFFADLACRTALQKTEYILPYGDYLLSEDVVTGDLKVATPSPEIGIVNSLWKLVFTVGWRF